MIIVLSMIIFWQIFLSKATSGEARWCLLYGKVARFVKLRLSLAFRTNNLKYDAVGFVGWNSWSKRHAILTLNLCSLPIRTIKVTLLLPCVLKMWMSTRWPNRLSNCRHPLLGRSEELHKYRATLQNALQQQHQAFTRYRDHQYGIAFIVSSTSNSIVHNIIYTLLYNFGIRCTTKSWNKNNKSSLIAHFKINVLPSRVLRCQSSVQARIFINIFWSRVQDWLAKHGW